MFKSIFENVKIKHPLVQNITNYVTINDCANIILACGGSPIMAEDENEVSEIASICNGLNINAGNLDDSTVRAMIISGKKANEINNPIVLDPVGAGASKLRSQTNLKLLNEIKFSVIRANASEIKSLASGNMSTKGVDASESDKITEYNLDETIKFVKSFAEKTNSVIAMTGAIDIVSDNQKTYIIRNGHSMMATVTGTGCQLSAMTAAFISANPSRILESAAASVCAMGLAGEIAYNRLTKLDGNSSYRNYIIDAIYNLTPEELDKGAKYEIR